MPFQWGLRGSLLAWALGATPFLAGSSWAEAVDQPRSESVHDEVVISATRESDELTTARVTTALEQDPYIFAAHVSVTTENGIVRLEGRTSDLRDLRAILRLARKIAGKARVVNAIEFMPSDTDEN
ncbi:MAG: BON domain-containing protein [Sinobacteraceae bacterium]|nr:BON domain-containing protein [Nevskiaceae bacterium]